MIYKQGQTVEYKGIACKVKGYGKNNILILESGKDVYNVEIPYFGVIIRNEK